MSRAAPRIAMVLAAGRGERMRPLSDALPKPALPLPDGPVVSWAMRLAAEAGASRIVVNSWHLARYMESTAMGVEIPGVEIQVSREDHLMGTAGGLALARDRGLLDDDGPVLVLNGDGVLHLDLSPLIARHAASDGLATLALLPHLDPTRWSRVLLDRSGNVSRFASAGAPERGEVPLLYPGVMVVSRSALERLEAAPSAIGDRLWAPALSEGRLGGVLVPGHWREVGTAAEYLEAALSQLRGELSIHPTAKIEASAEVRSGMIGRESIVGSGAVIERSVIAEGAIIGSGAVVARSVVLGAVHVTDGEIVEGDFRAAHPPWA